ncbi:MAG: hypothetical protein HYR63_04505 [Proteobacteria bacterium]|nr:hypothetical protein [Pseudomonadota bacterium]MBI3499628.1 hypothetical protein [Pseudomonadota bacterium]
MSQTFAHQITDIVSERPQAVRLPDWFSALPGQDIALSQSILRMDQLVRDHGIHLYPQHDFHLFKVCMEANQNTKAGLAPMYDPIHCKLGPENSLWLAGLDEHGDIVTTQSGKLFNFTGTNLREAGNNLTLFYDNPPSADAGVRCRIESPFAMNITGICAHSGGIWVHPRYRGVGPNGLRLSQILGRITRNIILATWSPDYIFSFAQTILARKGVVASYGWPNVQTGVTMTFPYCGAVDDVLAWSSRAELLDDARQIAMGGPLTRPLVAAE